MIKLTPRQQLILDMLLAGRTYREIARKLHITLHGVSVHVSNIGWRWGVDKTRYDNRSRVVFLEMRRLGLVPEWEDVT